MATVTYTLTVVRGEDQYVGNGWDLASPDCPITFADPDDHTATWLEAQGVTWDNPDAWVLVTPAGQGSRAVNEITHQIRLAPGSRP